MPDAVVGDTTGTPAGAAAADENKPITRAELSAFMRELRDEIPKVTNAAVTGHLKRLDVDGRMSKALEPFKSLLPKPKGEGEVADEVGEAATTAAPTAVAGAQSQQRQADPEVETLKRQMAALKGDSTKANQERAKAERSRIEEAGIAAFRAELSGKVLAGVEQDVVDLLRARGKIAITDAGAVLVKLGRPEDPEEGLSLKDGVEAFLKSDSAKHFLPAPSAQRSPGRPPFSGPPGLRTPANSPADAFYAKYGMTPEEMVMRG